MDVQKCLFPSAFEAATPPGAEGWQDLYPYCTHFQPGRRARDDATFWFCNSQHWPTPFRPFDTIMLDFAIKGLGQHNARHLPGPPANGVDCRILNGYVYFSPVAVAPELIEKRVPVFMERAGFDFRNWNHLYANGKTKVLGMIRELDAIEFRRLPEVQDIAVVTGGVGLDSTTALFGQYDRAISLCYRIWQVHFAFLNLGYAACLDVFGVVKEPFPTIPDQAIAKMVQGVDSEPFRPDDEIKGLAKLAVASGCADALKTGSVAETLAAVAKTPGGAGWLKAWEAAKDPWFNFTSGNGFYSTDKYWIDHLEIRFACLRDHIARVEEGGEIMRPTEALLKERDRITEEYREMMDEDAQAVFDGKLGLARTVFPYVEDHNFHIEHLAPGTFWRKMRQLSAPPCEEGFWENPDDMFFLNRGAVRDVLRDHASSWAIGVGKRRTDLCPAEIARRRGIHAARSAVRPLPAFDTPPMGITGPFTIMLRGITADAIRRRVSPDQEGGGLKGMAAARGAVAGVARLLSSPDQQGEPNKGEILVTPVTAPSCAPEFGKISAAVTDIGGMMSHAAIVCREYGLPAVTGTGNASARIATGMRLRVDGNQGTVTILD